MFSIPREKHIKFFLHHNSLESDIKRHSLPSPAPSARTSTSSSLCRRHPFRENAQGGRTLLCLVLQLVIKRETPERVVVAVANVTQSVPPAAPAAFGTKKNEKMWTDGTHRGPDKNPRRKIKGPGQQESKLLAIICPASCLPVPRCRVRVPRIPSVPGTGEIGVTGVVVVD